MHFPKTITIVLLLSLTAHLTFGQTIKTSNSPMAKVDSFIQMQGAAFAKEYSFVALSIGVTQNGKTYFYNFGTTKYKQKQLPSSTTTYEIGSISKTITGTLLAQAVIDGKVRLDDDIRKYISANYPNLEYEGQPIRLSHLLNHSSGLPFNLPVKPGKFVTLQDSIAFEQKRTIYTPKDFFTDLHQIKLVNIPGVNLNYSNAATQLLGFILERIYQMPFNELVQKYIASPLKMNRTYSLMPKTQQLPGHNGIGKTMSYVLPQEAAAAGIYSTTEDLIRYAQWHIDESNPVVKLTHQPTWGNIQYYAMGLNWQMDDKAPMPRRVFQSGGTLGFSSYLIIHPEQKNGIVLLTNVSDQNTQGQLSVIAKEVLKLLEQ
ncbi:serine hydrolase [Emticicia sp. C21]|uniref:serine hydrolase domain-containing protein n=1 Tax=Emticicia sp. C21 TaxID=2302915 RepID=UPI000E3523C0|nr:serine hydrolase domain-containing protein [Emticicia sp. C21]RFS14131.1 class A beta-lactamase-related serine hydrolase [Emticicia sp. C21]